MATIIPYINFAKSTAAITFYKTVFGGDAEAQSEGERITHFEFKAGDIHFMGSDLQSGQAGLGPGSGVSLVLNCDSEGQLRDFYAKLVDGGTEVCAPTESGWGAIIAHCADKFGLIWMLNYDTPQN